MNISEKETIERMKPKNLDQWDNLIQYFCFLRHQFAYEKTREYVQDKNCLDYGFGTGYGTFMLADNAERIIGIDINEDAFQYANKNYSKPNLFFKKIDGSSKLPFDDAAFDIVISFQVIEHIKDVNNYLSEIKRILRKNGKFICTTPNRDTRLWKFQKPFNPFHIREYNKRELYKLLKKFFSQVEIKGIYGIQFIQETEMNRLKPNITLYEGAKSLIKLLLPERVLKSYKNIIDFNKKNENNNTNKRQNIISIEEMKKYSWNDYYFDLKDIKKSIDLYVVVSK